MATGILTVCPWVSQEVSESPKGLGNGDPLDLLQELYQFVIINV